MVTAIKAAGCAGGVFTNNIFIGLDVGIELIDSDATIENSDFIGTKIAVKGTCAVFEAAGLSCETTSQFRSMLAAEHR